CTLHLQLAYAHCICSLHLQESICTLHLQIAFVHCICKHLHIAFASICTLHLQAKGRIIGIKRHLIAVEVIAANMEVTTAGYVSTASKDYRKYSKTLLLLE
ncbi:hypothetical protein Tco_1023708, partial [Tanacetum coccineum]